MPTYAVIKDPHKTPVCYEVVPSADESEIQAAAQKYSANAKGLKINAPDLTQACRQAGIPEATKVLYSARPWGSPAMRGPGW